MKKKKLEWLCLLSCNDGYCGLIDIVGGAYCGYELVECKADCKELEELKEKKTNSKKEYDQCIQNVDPTDFDAPWDCLKKYLDS